MGRVPEPLPTSIAVTFERNWDLTSFESRRFGAIRLNKRP